jgi:glutamate carboxypeptidase
MTTAVDTAQTARALDAALRARSDDLIDFWRTLVNTDSGSTDLDGVRKVGDLLATRLEALGFAVDSVRPDPRYGEHRVARRHRDGGRTGTLALIGHLDTVWQEPIVHQWPFSIDGGLAYGPGVGDMKGGLVAAIGALEALDALGIPGPADITFILVADEELGSPSGRAVVEDAVRGSADWAMCLEPSGSLGYVRTSGGGLGVYYVTTHGRTAHITEPDGISALREMAEKLIAFENLTNADRSLVVGVGVAKGGYAKQVVPDRAEMILDLRAHTADLLLEGDRLIRETAARTFVPGTTTHLEGGITRPVFPRTDGTGKLFDQAKTITRQLGISDYEEHWSGGGSDGNFVAALGIPIIDSMGPVCHEGCSLRESVDVDTLFTKGALMGTLMASIDPATLQG